MSRQLAPYHRPNSSRRSRLPSGGESSSGSGRLPSSHSVPISQESPALSLVLARNWLESEARHDDIPSMGLAATSTRPNDSIKFVNPASWVQDQTLFYRAVGKAEFEIGIDPPPLNDPSKRRRSVNEPSVAFGPLVTNGELNVSVIISTVPLDFSIEPFGSPMYIGEAITKTVVGSSRRYNVTGSLVNSTVREDSFKDVKYFTLEFKVESPSFRRHNIVVCCVNKGKLYTLNAQAPETEWQKVKSNFYNIAESFALAT